MHRMVSVWVVMEIANPALNPLQVYFDKNNIPDEIWKNYVGQVPEGEEMKYFIRECSGSDSLDFCKEISKEVLSGVRGVSLTYEFGDNGEVVTGMRLDVANDTI